jgi:oligoribonuclease (3'-5' exoribonuclease)
MNKSKLLPVKVTEEHLNRIEAIANRLNVNRSVVVRKMIDVCLEDELYMVVNDMVNKSGNEKLQATNGLFKLLQEYLKHIKGNLDRNVLNETLQFISFLQNNIANGVQDNIRQMVTDQVMTKSFNDAK